MTIGQNIGKPDSFTKLLISGRNPANIADLATGKTITNVGSVAFQNTYTKLNPNALSFNGSKYLRLAQHNDFVFGTGDFTIDLWCYFNQVTASNGIIDFRPPSTAGSYVYFGTTAASKFTLAVGAGYPILTDVISKDTWYHAALVRSNGTSRIYINGTQSGSDYSDTNDYACGTNRPLIGGNGYAGTATLNGYIDEFRVSKGIARWTGNFTPPKRNYHHQSI